MKNSKKRKILFSILALIIASSFVMSAYGQLSEFDILSEPRTIDQRYFENEGYDAAIWVNKNEVGAMIGSRLMAERIAAISGASKFPCDDMLNLVYGYATSDQLNFEFRSPLDIRFYTESPVIDTERTAAIISWYGYSLVQSSIYIDRAQSISSQYQVETLVVNNYDTSTNLLTITVMETSYCVFHNQKAKMYYIMYP